DADIYFVANTSNETREVTLTFRTVGIPEIWDPMTARNVTPQSGIGAGNAVVRQLRSEPYRSYVIASSKTPSCPVAGSPPTTIDSVVDLTGDWKVTFGSQPPVTMLNLHSWTDDESTRFFSGTATYERTITVPDAFTAGGKRAVIDFGEAVPLPVQL